MSDTMREAARLEASALYESEDTYNHPEEVMAKAFERGAAWQAAQSQPAPPEITTLANRIAELIAQHGTLRAAAAVINIDVGYLSRLASGEKVRPGKEFLRRMGLRVVTTYERIK